jgi:hypothetical protein
MTRESGARRLPSIGPRAAAANQIAGRQREFIDLFEEHQSCNWE